MGPQDEHTLTFRDGAEQWKSSFSSKHDPTRDVTVLGDVSLANFFARPVKIAEYIWDPAAVTPFYQAFDPWTLFMQNPRVSNRISNYRLFSGKLNVKLLVNGNAFYFGRLMTHYTPLSLYDSVSVWSNTGITALVQASQTLHAFVDPTLSQGCELELPFVWFNDMIDLTLGEQANLGIMYIREMNILKHANGATDPLAIQVFAWCTDVKLSVPTVVEPSFLTPQSGKFNNKGKSGSNEYSKSPISTVASTAAAMMGSLSTIPIIGSYATATSMVMSGAAGLARLFGYSRPALIDDYTDIRPNIISRMAVTNAGDNVAKLTVDSKQEVSIDPSIVGVGTEDEMVISSIAKKESYLTLFPWQTSAAPGAVLWATRVAPIWNVVSNTYYLPAVTYAAIPFKFWHGTIKYRFQIVASAYHRGRLLIVWDPIAQPNTVETNVQYSKIIDLADERDFTFEVGWGAPTRWLEHQKPTSTNYFSTALPYTVASPTYFNGTLTVYVLNDLTSPNSLVNNDIGINVFMSACDDIEFAVPDVFPTYARSVPSITAQSGEFDEGVVTTDNAPIIETVQEQYADCLPSSDASNLVYMGERITSFRQLIKRYTLWCSFYDATATAAFTYAAYPDFPTPRGFDRQGVMLNGANGFNPTNTTMLNYMSYAFLAYRGGVRRKYILTSGATSNLYANVTRLISNNVGPVANGLQTVAKVVSTGLAFSQNIVNLVKPYTSTGTHVTSIKQQPCVEVELPFYHRERFVSPRLQSTPITATNIKYSIYELCHTFTYEHEPSVSSFDVYVAGAEDSTFIGFQGCCPIRFTGSI